MVRTAKIHKKIVTPNYQVEERLDPSEDGASSSFEESTYSAVEETIETAPEAESSEMSDGGSEFAYNDDLELKSPMMRACWTRSLRWTSPTLTSARCRSSGVASEELRARRG